jgi:hypothetical protein
MEFMGYFTLVLMVLGPLISLMVVWRKMDRSKSFHEKAG